MFLPSFERSYLWFPAGRMGDGLADQERPAASEEEWGRVDSLYREVSAELRFAVYVLLTDRPAKETAGDLYIFLEPFAHLALAIDRERGAASICADWWMWMVFETEFRELQEHAGKTVRASRTIDALVESLSRLRALLRGEWQVSFGPATRAVITQGTRRWEVERG
jgi:hypothetical protein